MEWRDIARTQFSKAIGRKVTSFDITPDDGQSVVEITLEDNWKYVAVCVYESLKTTVEILETP